MQKTSEIKKKLLPKDESCGIRSFQEEIYSNLERAEGKYKFLNIMFNIMALYYDSIRL